MRSLQRLAGHFLDVVAGLPTLKVFGRAKAQARAIAEVTDRYRTTTLATLRLTFLSSLILELLATVSVALVAVAVGLRLLDGHMNFHAALFVLVLAPEAYLPLRALGANFHASADGMKAAEQVFELLETPVGEGDGRLGPAAGHEHPRSPGSRSTTRAAASPPCTAPTSSSSRARWWPSPAPAAAASPPSSTSSSGCAAPVRARCCSAGWTCATSTSTPGGPASAGCPSGRTSSPAPWPTTSVSGDPAPATAEVAAALEAAGLASVVRRLPHGVDTRLGDGGAGLSLGERQRLALARAFVRDAPLLVLDEPTASLDAETEADVLDAVRRLTEGRTALVVAHRPALAALADRVVLLPLPAVAA